MNRPARQSKLARNVSQGSPGLDGLDDGTVPLGRPLAPRGPALNSPLTAPQRLLFRRVILFPLVNPPRAVLMDTTSGCGHF